MYINTSASLTSATLLGFVPRRGGQAVSGSYVSGTSTTSSSGWYQYTFTIPTTFNSSTNYIAFKAVSKYGDNIYLDGNIVMTTYPAATVYSLTGGGCISSTVGLSGSQTGWSYQLQVGGSNTGSAVSGTGSAISFGSESTTGTYSVVATNGTTSATANMGTGVSVVSTPTVTGTAYACAGATSNLSATPTGGTWASANTSIATVSGGTVTGVASGNTTISYTSSGCAATKAYTVNAVPTLSGGGSVCLSSTITLNPTPTGGTWASSNSSIASVSAGVVTGAAVGSANISYTGTNGCVGVQAVNVTTMSPASISGGTTAFCANTTTSLTDATTGGTWSSSNTGIAAVNTSGVVTGVSGGNATITYSSGCGTPATKVLTVNAGPAAMTGTPATCVGGITTLADVTSGGTWSSSATGTATVNASGVVTGIATGNATISYTIGTCYSTLAATVNAAPSGGGFSFSPSAPSVCLGSGVAETVTYSVTPTTILSQSWESGVPTAVGTPVNGWSLLSGSTTGYILQDGSSSYPTISSAESGSYYLDWESFNASSGSHATLASSSFSLSGYSSVTLSLWVYRDYGDSYNSSTYSTEGFTFYVNNSQATGGTTLGYIPRDCAFAVTGFSGTSQPTSSGWYNYTVTVPTTYGATNYLVIYCYSDYGDNCNLDNIVISGTSSTPTYTWSGGSGLSCNTCANPTITPTVTGSSVYTVIATTLGCNMPTTLSVSVNALPTVSISPTNGCYGSPMTASGASTYTWSPATFLNATTGATVTSTPTVATTYTVTGTATSGCMNTATKTVNLLPTLTGSSSECVGNSITLNPAPTGGTWASSNTSVATVSGGVVTGAGTGTVSISYTSTLGCVNTQTVYVNNSGPASISGGTSSFCATATTTLSDATAGGTWSSSNTVIATVNSSGVVSGITTGMDTITYSDGCGTPATQVVTVAVMPASITGLAQACVSGVTTLADGVGGGTWSSSATSTASVNTVGVVTGVAAGNATISYTVGSCYTTQQVTINTGLTSGFSFSPSSSTLCLGNAVSEAMTFTVSPVNIMTQSWESGVPTAIGTPVAGWSLLTGSTTGYLLQDASSSYPTISSAESGSYYLDWESFNAASGDHATLASSSFSLSGYTGTTLSVWVYRDYGDAYNTSGYSAEGFTFYLNNSQATGGTTLGFIPRDCAFAVTGFTGTSMPTSSGWYNYTVSLPTTYGATNYLVIYCYSEYGDNSNLDNIVVSGTPVPTYSWSGIGGGLSCSTCTNPAITPTVTGSDPYYVTATAAGCNVVGTLPVSVNPLPSVSFSSASGCTGIPVSVSGASTYTWAPGTGLASTTGATLTPNPSSMTIYTVTGTSSTTTCSNKATLTVNLTPALTVNASPTALCSGSNVTLNATSSVSGSVYTWSGPASYNNTNLNPGASACSASGAYTLIAANGTCTATATTPSVTVYAQPSVTLSASTNQICSGGSETLTASPSGGFGTAVYSWSGPGIATSTGSTASPAAFVPTVASAATGAYSVTLAYSGSGCNSATAATSVVTVAVQPSVSLVASATSLCSGGSELLTASPSGGIGSAIYTWSGPGIATSTGTTASPVAFAPTVASTTTGSYSVSVSYTGTGCNNTLANSASVTINPQPNVSLSASNPVLCSGGLQTLSAIVTGGSGAPVYTWSGPGIATNTGTTATPSAYTTSVSSSTTGNYSVSVVFPDLGCNTALGTSSPVTVNPQPGVTVSASDPAVCSGGAETLTASVSGGAGTAVYAWSGPGIATTTGSAPSVVATPTVSIATTGSYSLQVSFDGVGCNTASAATSTVSIAPQPTVSLSNSVNSLCSGSNEVLTATASGGAGAAVYTWSGPGIATTTGTTATPAAFVPTVATTTAGAYTVALNYSGAGCSGVAAVSDSVVIDPQPALGSISISADTVCGGASISLTQSGGSVPSTGANVFTWSGPTGIVNTTNTLSGATFTAADSSYTGAYSLTAVYSESGCAVSGLNTSTLVVGNQATGTISFSSPTLVCNGYSEVLTALVSGGSGTPTYTWSGPGISTPVVTGAGSYTTTPNAGGSYTLTVAFPVSGCNTDTIVSSPISVVPLTWTGSVSADWNNGGNWNCGFAPHATDSIIIPSGTTYSPGLLSSGTSYIHYMSVNSGSFVNMISGANLNVTGNLVNNGTFTGQGKLVMAGSTSQTISGVGSVRHVEIANSNGVSMNTTSDTMFVTGLMHLTNGTFNTKGTLVLSTSDDTIAGPNVNGSIAPVTSGTIGGQVIVQQYIKGGRRAYRFWGTPFVDSIALSQLENYIDITGSTGSVRGFTYTSSNAPSAYWYDTKHANSSATGSAGDPGWMPFTWCKDSMSGGVQVSADSNMVHRFEGIRLFVRGSKGQGLDGSSYTPNAVTVRQWGNVNIGSLDMQLQVGSLVVSGAPAQNYNQKSNPYPSPVDIGSVVYSAWVDSQLYQPYLYVWNPYAAAAGAFVTVSESSLTPYVIPMNASFQVRAKVDHASLYFSESNKSSAPNAELLKEEGSELVKLTVYDEQYHEWDALNLTFNAGASANEEWIDAGKAVNPDLNFYSWSADHRPLCRDFRPYESGKVIPLGLTTQFKQAYIIKADLLNLPDGGQLYLHDKYLSKYVLLTPGTEYPFSVTRDEASQGDHRFELGMSSQESAMGANTNHPELKALLMPNPATTSVNVTFVTPGTGNAKVTVMTVEGIALLEKDLGAAATGNVVLDLESFAAGIYVVELQCGDKKVVQRLVKE